MDQERNKWELNPRELLVRDLDIHEDSNHIISICSKYGQVIKFRRTLDKTNMYLTYLSESQVAQAILQLPTIGCKVSYACVKVQNDAAGENSKLKACTNCGAEAELNCKRCGVSYDSKLCQTGHMPILKKECISIPDLVPNVQMSASQRSMTIASKTAESIKTKISRSYDAKIRAHNGDTSGCPQSKFRIKKLENSTVMSKIRVTALKHYQQIKRATTSEIKATAPKYDPQVNRPTKSQTRVTAPKYSPDTNREVKSQIRVTTLKNYQQVKRATTSEIRATEPKYYGQVNQPTKSQIPVTIPNHYPDINQAANSQIPVTAPKHYPEVKGKRGVCRICNDQTREHCSLCQFYLCITKRSCFLNSHFGKPVHFASHVEAKSIMLCKNCNERKAKYQCVQCFNKISGKTAYFCITSKRNCFQEFHKSNNL